MKMSDRKFKTPDDLVVFVKQQINKDIIALDTFSFKKTRGICYMEIPKETIILSLLKQQGITLNDHMKNRYFVTLV